MAWWCFITTSGLLCREEGSKAQSRAQHFEKRPASDAGLYRIASRKACAESRAATALACPVAQRRRANARSCNFRLSEKRCRRRKAAARKLSGCSVLFEPFSCTAASSARTRRTCWQKLMLCHSVAPLSRCAANMHSYASDRAATARRRADFERSVVCSDISVRHLLYDFLPHFSMLRYAVFSLPSNFL